MDADVGLWHEAEATDSKQMLSSEGDYVISARVIGSGGAVGHVKVGFSTRSILY